MVVFGQRFIYTENMKGTVVEKVVSKERGGLGQDVHFHGTMKRKVTEKVGSK